MAAAQTTTNWWDLGTHWDAARAPRQIYPQATVPAATLLSAPNGDRCFVSQAGELYEVPDAAPLLPLLPLTIRTDAQTLRARGPLSVEDVNAPQGWARWVAGREEDDWLAPRSVIQHDGIATITFDFYLPASEASPGPKALRVVDGDGVLADVTVARDGITRAKVDIPAGRRYGFIEITCAPEPRLEGGDARQLGVVLAGIDVEEAADAQSGRAARNDKLLARYHAGTSAYEPQARGGAKRAAVVCWDLGHNPAGRAYVLYRLLEKGWDVELVGPRWKQFGGALWGPVRSLGLNVRSFPCATFSDFYPQAFALAKAERYDLVYVCKPRLPGLLLGAMMAEEGDCPLILDIDDNELSFFEGTDPAGAVDPAALRNVSDVNLQAVLAEPFGATATRLAYAAINGADAITVSNPALQGLHGGTIIRHARPSVDVGALDSARTKSRAALGIADDDFAVFFVGTIRRHKGVLALAQALDAAGPESGISLHLFAGQVDARQRERIDACMGARIIWHDGVDLGNLQQVMAGADAVVLLQDEGSEIAQYQIPAKISDALSVGVPVLATPVPPLLDLIERGAVIKTSVVTVVEQLRELARMRSDARTALLLATFAEDFSEDANRTRLDGVLDSLPNAHPSAVMADLRSLGEQLYRACLPSPKSVTTGGGKEGIDIVWFWKQNDCGLYGRRADLLPRYLLRTGKVRKILRFDLRMSAAKLHRQSHLSDDLAAQHFKVQQATVASHFHANDAGGLRCRTYIYDGAASEPDMAAYVSFIQRQMADFGIVPGNATAWVCPVVPGFAELQQALGFRQVVVDLVDDQRTFSVPDEIKTRWDENYKTTLPLADHVIANCAPLAQAFHPLVRGDIHIVPNGADMAQVLTRPAEGAPLLAGIEAPIAGYVGNLRDRIDWPLVHRMATRFPSIAFVFIGAGLPDDVRKSFASMPNVHFPGVVPYSGLGVYLDHFTVGIMPHVHDEMTRVMHPLKLYSYLAHDLPVICSDVDNIEESILPAVCVAANDDEFADALIRYGIEREPMPQLSAEAMAAMSWDERAQRVLAIINN